MSALVLFSAHTFIFFHFDGIIIINLAVTACSILPIREIWFSVLTAAYLKAL